MRAPLARGDYGKEYSFQEKTAGSGRKKREVQSGREEEMLGPPAKETERENGRDGWCTGISKWVLIRNNLACPFTGTGFCISGNDDTDRDAREEGEHVADSARSVDGDDKRVDGEGVMETDANKPRFSKKYLEKLSQAWRSRNDRRKKKRLAHTRKDKW